MVYMPEGYYHPRKGGGEPIYVQTSPPKWQPITPGVYQMPGSADAWIIGSDGTMTKTQTPDQPKVQYPRRMVQNDQGIPLWEQTDAAGNVTYTPVTPSEWELYQKLGLVGGGDGGGGKWVGTLPDPATAAQLLLKHYEDQIQASNGQFDAAMALSNFQKDWNEFLRLWQTTNVNIQAQYGIQESDLANQAKNRQLGLYQTQADIWRQQQQEITQRGATIASQVLPRFVPGLTGIQLPFVQGTLPTIQMKPSDIYSWVGAGAPGLATPPEAPPGIGEPAPLGPAPQLPAPPPMPSLPSMPQYPAPPDISNLVNLVTWGIRVQ